MSVLDFFKKKKPQITEQGMDASAEAPRKSVSGLRYDPFGFPRNVEHNAEVVLKKLVGTDWEIGISDKMMADPQVAAVTNLIMFTALGCRVTVAPGDDTNEGRKRAEFTRHVLFKNMDFQDIFYHDLLSLRYGMVPFEIESYGINNEVPNVPGVFRGYRLLPIKTSSVRWIERTEREKLVRIVQQVEAREYPVSVNDLRIVTYRKEFENLHGRAWYREIYSPWRDKLKALIIQFINSERGGGFPVIEELSNTTDKDDLEDRLSNIRIHQQGFLVLTKDQGKFRFERAQGAASEDGMKIVYYLDNAIAKTALATFMMLGTDGSTGNRATGDVQAEAFYNSLRYICGISSRAYNFGHSCGTPAFIRKLELENFGPGPVSELIIHDPSKEDAGRLLTMYQALTAARNLDPDDEKEVRERMGLMNVEIGKELKRRRDEWRAAPPPAVPEVRGDDGGIGDPAKENPLGSNGVLKASVGAINMPGVDLANIGARFDRAVDEDTAAIEQAWLTAAAEMIARVAEFLSKGDIAGARGVRVPLSGAEAMQRAVRSVFIREYTAATSGIDAEEETKILAILAGLQADLEGAITKAALGVYATDVAPTVEVAQSVLKQKVLTKPRSFFEGVAHSAAAVSVALDLARAARRGHMNMARRTMALEGKNVCAVCESKNGREFPAAAIPFDMRTPDNSCLGGRERCRCVILYF